MESFFINQNYGGHNLLVERNSKLLEYVPLAESSFEHELRAFKEKFSFYLSTVDDDGFVIQQVHSLCWE